MKVKSIGTNGSDLPDYFFKLGNFAFPTSDYQLQLGSIYPVYGMSLYNHVLHYLLFPNDMSYPDWYPAPFFEIIDNSLPKEWYFAYFGYQDEESKKIPLGALWGYYELVFQEKDFAHYEGLIIGDPTAMEIFSKRKKEIDDLS